MTKSCKRYKEYEKARIKDGLLKLPDPFIWLYVLEGAADAIAWLGQTKEDRTETLYYCVEVFAKDEKPMDKVLTMIANINVPCATIRWIALDPETVERLAIKELSS